MNEAKTSSAGGQFWRRHCRDRLYLAAAVVYCRRTVRDDQRRYWPFHSGLFCCRWSWVSIACCAAKLSLPSFVALLVGIAGFLTMMTGSILLLTNRIDFQLSLLPGIGGFGLVGLWVLIHSLLALRSGALPRSVAWAGILLAITPSLALLAVFRLETVANGLTGMAGQAGGFQIVYLSWRSSCWALSATPGCRSISSSSAVCS